MTNTTRIVLTIVNPIHEPFEANYAIIKGRVHLYVGRDCDIKGAISKAFCREVTSGIEGVLFDCRLRSMGNNYGEYVAQNAFLGEGEIDYELNAYNSAEFTLSNDIVRFFDAAWIIEYPMSPAPYQVISFVSREDREEVIKLTENINFVIRRGYKQRYSKVRYEAHASLGFRFQFKEPLGREKILNLIKGITDYYSVFCQNFIAIEFIQLLSANYRVGYLGDLLGSEIERDYFSNVLTEQCKIDHYSQQSLVTWIMEYDKGEQYLQLMRDAQSIADERLKFICYTRSLEVFHKVYFALSENATTTYFDDLHDFVVANKLSGLERKKFASSSINLAHRLYDLARFVYPSISDKRHVLLFTAIKKKGGIQEIVDTRNYLTHFSDSKKNKALSSGELPHVNFCLYLFLKVLQLKRCGFNEKAIRSVIGTFYRYYFGA